jgi:signal transduction histidine kinase
VLGCQRIAITVVNPENGATRALAVAGLKPDEERRWWAEQRAAEKRGARLDDSPDQELIQRLHSGQPVTVDLREPRYQGIPNEYGIQTLLVAPMLIAERLVGYISLDYSGQAHQFAADELDLASAVAKLAALVIERDHMLREQAAAEAQLLALEQANQRMNEFLGIAAHELRTPITVIKANLQMLMRRVAVFNERAAGSDRVVIEAQRLARFSDLLNRTEKSLTRLTRLVDDLLDVSRVHAGKLEMRIEPTDLAAITREAVEEQRVAVSDREITIELPADLPTQIVADPERVEQVITNYLTNALKYSAADKPVRVRLWRDGAMLYVGVTDEGPSIPPEHQERVWELFHRVPGIEVVSGSGIGLGLGLHLCKTLIERQGGHVGVVSQPGQGSTFWLSLPLCDDEAIHSGDEAPR